MDCTKEYLLISDQDTASVFVESRLESSNHTPITHPHTQWLLHHERHHVHELLGEIPGGVKTGQRRRRQLRERGAPGIRTHRQGIAPWRCQGGPPGWVTCRVQRIVHCHREQQNTSSRINLEIWQRQPVYECYGHFNAFNLSLARRIIDCIVPQIQTQ